MPCIDGGPSGPEISSDGWTLSGLTDLLCQLDRWATQKRVTTLPELFEAWRKDHRKADQARVMNLTRQRNQSIARLKKQQQDIQMELKKLRREVSETCQH